MKIEINSVEIYDKKFDNWSEIHRELGTVKQDAGESEARYDFSALALICAGWALKKAADELVNWYLRQSKELEQKRDRDIDRHADKKQHEELMNKLEVLIEKTSEQSREGFDADKFLDWVNENQILVTVKFETEAEGDLRSAFLNMQSRTEFLKIEDGS